VNALEILTKSRDLLASHFTTCRFTDGNGRFCALGAINKVSGESNAQSNPNRWGDGKDRHGTPRQRALFFLSNAINGEIQATDYNYVSIWMANDRRGREYMLEAFGQAIRNCCRRHTTKRPLAV
jgi:hypothetical protein